MLKIKEYRYLSEDGKTITKKRINLKELETYGFKECADYFYYPKARLQADICVSKRTRTISLFDFIGYIDGRHRDRRASVLREIDIVKKLEKADLVEKC